MWGFSWFEKMLLLAFGKKKQLALKLRLLIQKAKRGVTDPTCCIELWQPRADSGNKSIASPFPKDFLWTLLHRIRETNSKRSGNIPAGSSRSTFDEEIWMIDQRATRFDGPIRGWRNPLRCAPEEMREEVGGGSFVSVKQKLSHSSTSTQNSNRSNRAGPPPTIFSAARKEQARKEAQFLLGGILHRCRQSHLGEGRTGSSSRLQLQLVASRLSHLASSLRISLSF